jgi:DnaJ-class molecular chaperone
MVPPVAPTLARPPAGPATPPPPPAAATKGTLEASQIAELAARCAKLNQIDYFEVLQISRDATPADIKKAFYSESRAYHPDRFYQLESKELKDQVNELYKRFTESSEAESKAAVKKEHEEQIGVHPKGRQFYQLGHNDFEAGRWSAAERNLKMALTYEPANARYKERLLEAQRKLNDESKAKGEAFKIK